MTEQENNDAERKEKAKRAPRTASPSNPQVAAGSVVFVGNKPVMNYVLACMTHLNSGSNKIVVKARGRAIPRAVDAVEVLRRSFAKGVGVQDINLSTEEVDREQGQKSKVSAIEISIVKQ
jgi:DNA-binding protein